LSGGWSPSSPAPPRRGEGAAEYSGCLCDEGRAAIAVIAVTDVTGATLVRIAVIAVTDVTGATLVRIAVIAVIAVTDVTGATRSGQSGKPEAAGARGKVARNMAIG